MWAVQCKTLEHVVVVVMKDPEQPLNQKTPHKQRLSRDEVNLLTVLRDEAPTYPNTLIHLVSCSNSPLRLETSATSTGVRNKDNAAPSLEVASLFLCSLLIFLAP